MASHKTDIFRKHIKEPLEDADPESDQASEVEGFGKSKVECICPRCAKMHIMKMRWIGRGVPRKFCQNCRDRETPLDDED
jgi:transposase-like protein